jgi:hypothetical protein
MRASFDLPADVPLSSLATEVNSQSTADLKINGVPAGFGPVFVDPKTVGLFKYGRNVLAVTAHDSPKAQFVSVKLRDMGYRAVSPTQVAAPAGGVKPAFSLKGGQGVWSDAYMALANPSFATWTSPQSEPTMLPPYHAGANKSKLIDMLEKGHNGVKLSAEELDRLSTWIDLAVPCYGDYTEGIRGGELEKYKHFLDKRTRWEEQEERNIQELIRYGH